MTRAFSDRSIRHAFIPEQSAAANSLHGHSWAEKAATACVDPDLTSICLTRRDAMCSPRKLPFRSTEPHAVGLEFDTCCPNWLARFQMGLWSCSFDAVFTPASESRSLICAACPTAYKMSCKSRALRSRSSVSCLNLPKGACQTIRRFLTETVSLVILQPQGR